MQQQIIPPPPGITVYLTEGHNFFAAFDDFVGRAPFIFVEALGGDDQVDLSNVTRATTGMNLGLGNDRGLMGPLGGTASGGPGRDRIEGNRGADSLFGEEGPDSLFGKGGNDWLVGGAHNDDLYGGAGSDRLFGMIGNDRLYGGGGKDFLSGGFRGTDVFSGGDGYDVASEVSLGDWLEDDVEEVDVGTASFNSGQGARAPIGYAIAEGPTEETRTLELHYADGGTIDLYFAGDDIPIVTGVLAQQTVHAADFLC